MVIELHPGVLVAAIGLLAFLLLTHMQRWLDIRRSRRFNDWLQRENHRLSRASVKASHDELDALIRKL